MAIIPLGTDDWESASENIPRIKLHNMYIAEDPASPDGKTRVSRPTLGTSGFTLPTGPCYGAWQLDGALSDGTLGQALVVNGTILYSIDTHAHHATSLGTVSGVGYCQFAGTRDRVIIVRDQVAYSTDGSTVSIVAIPDGQPVGSVATIDGYFLLSIDGSNKFYWIAPGGTDPDPLDFASAERYPDPIISINISNDEIWFLGSKGPEVWQVTGNLDAPFERIPARDYNEGCYSRDTAINVTYNDMPAVVWVTSSGAVTLAQGRTHRISNESIEELLRGVQSTFFLRAWHFRYNRHDFYVLTADASGPSPGFTVVYDLTTQSWSRWDSYGTDQFRAHLGFQVGAAVYAGDVNTNALWLLEEGSNDNGDPVIREVSGGVFNTGKPYSCNDVIVRVNAGWAPGYDSEPVLEMKFSDDQGATWSSYSQGTGLRGQYMTDVVYRSLGLVQRPGRLFEFRFTDDARIRIDYATINEAYT